MKARVSVFTTTEVVGEITNLTDGALGCSLSATFFAKDGDILGRALGFVDGVPVGGTKTFSLLGEDDFGSARFTIQADACY